MCALPSLTPPAHSTYIRMYIHTYLEALVLRAEQRPPEETAEVGAIVVPEAAVEWPVAVDGVARKQAVVAVDV